MKKSIDGRNLPCPQPVIKVKQAFDEGGFNELEVLVDNQAAVENITRFAENSGHNIDSVTEKNKITTIVINNNNSEEASPKTESAPFICSSGPVATTIFINSATIGSGDDKLGDKLMEAFIYSLTEIEDKPENILMMNGGVHITVEGSNSIENLRTLEKSGINILVCGACLDFYGIKDKLQVGKVSNMYEIASVLLKNGNTVTVG
jgi:selenium metabolism protein YedF